MSTAAPDRDRLAPARQIADAVLYEGYVLYPYRASALKNRYRWQWGVVVPQAQVDVGASEPAALSCEVLLRAAPGTEVTVTARFLHLRLRQLVAADGTEVDELEVDGEPVPTWEEGLEHEIAAHVRVARSSDTATPVHAEERFVLDAGEEREQLGDAGFAVRSTWEVAGRLRAEVAAVDEDVWRLHVEVHNDTAWSQRRAPREEIVRRSLVGVHTLIDAPAGTFASVIDPPDWAAGPDEPRNRGLHPVLVNDDDTTVLAAPIILYDHPRIAPESPGPSFDATEVDELLALAVLGLTDDEKRRARATDPRAAQLIDRIDTLPTSVQRRLHGTVRELRPADLRPEPAAQVTDEVRELLGVGEEPLRAVRVGDHEVEVGDHVRLRPSRRADAHDLFAADRTARVERILRTVDGDTWLAVTIIDDPAADLDRWYGRFRYYGLDEVEPLTDGPTTTPDPEPSPSRSTHEGA